MAAFAETATRRATPDCLVRRALRATSAVSEDTGGCGEDFAIAAKKEAGNPVSFCASGIRTRTVCP